MTPAAAIDLRASPAYRATTAAATRRLDRRLRDLPKTRLLRDALIGDPEANALWDLANYTTLGKLGYNDHGRLHARLTGAAAVVLLDCLTASGTLPDVVSSGIGDLDDASLVVLAGGMLHDVGNALHREGQARSSVVLSEPILRRILDPIYGAGRTCHLIRTSTLATIHAHDTDPPPLTLEAAVVALADALDVTAGRGQIAFARGKVDIHAVSALAIDRVSVRPGTGRPILVQVDMHSDAGLFQLEQTLVRKLLRTPLRGQVEVRACIRGADTSPRIIDCLALAEGRLALDHPTT